MQEQAPGRQLTLRHPHQPGLAATRALERAGGARCYLVGVEGAAAGAAARSTDCALAMTHLPRAALVGVGEGAEGEGPGEGRLRWQEPQASLAEEQHSAAAAGLCAHWQPARQPSHLHSAARSELSSVSHRPLTLCPPVAGRSEQKTRARTSHPATAQSHQHDSTGAYAPRGDPGPQVQASRHRA